MDAHVFGVDDVRCDGEVASNADVVLTADLHRMFDVLDQVVGSRLPAHRQERYEVDADHSTFVGHSLEDVVRLAARPVGDGPAAEWLMAMGFEECSIASIVVCMPQCAVSTVMPCAFSFSTSCLPNGVRPPFSG